MPSGCKAHVKEGQKGIVFVEILGVSKIIILHKDAGLFLRGS